MTSRGILLGLVFTLSYFVLSEAGEMAESGSCIESFKQYTACTMECFEQFNDFVIKNYSACDGTGSLEGKDNAPCTISQVMTVMKCMAHKCKPDITSPLCQSEPNPDECDCDEIEYEDGGDCICEPDDENCSYYEEDDPTSESISSTTTCDPFTSTNYSNNTITSTSGAYNSHASTESPTWSHSESAVGSDSQQNNDDQSNNYQPNNDNYQHSDPSFNTDNQPQIPNNHSQVDLKDIIAAMLKHSFTKVPSSQVHPQDSDAIPESNVNPWHPQDDRKPPENVNPWHSQDDQIPPANVYPWLSQNNPKVNPSYSQDDPNDNPWHSQDYPWYTQDYPNFDSWPPQNDPYVYPWPPQNDKNVNPWHSHDDLNAKPWLQQGDQIPRTNFNPGLPPNYGYNPGPKENIYQGPTQSFSGSSQNSAQVANNPEHSEPFFGHIQNPAQVTNNPGSRQPNPVQRNAPGYTGPSVGSQAFNGNQNPWNQWK